METKMSDPFEINGIDDSLYDQALAEIREAYDRDHPRSSVAPDIAALLETIAADHAATQFLVAWRLASYLKDQLQDFRAHLDELVPAEVRLEAHRELTERFQKRFDDERLVPHCLMRTFANVGITEETAWRVVETHFAK